MRGKADGQVTMLSLVTANDLIPEDPPDSGDQADGGPGASRTFTHIYAYVR